MIEGAILLAELSLFLILLVKVWRVQHKNEDENTGFFAYRIDKQPEAPAKGGPPHA
ncbi:MAG: hypothetical protein KGZ67_07810 [Hydrogenophaga sp.]|nr:hypothetical protein [Hydrogenophaga sp.]